MALKLADLRRNYGNRELNEATVNPDPIIQFQKWLDEWISVESQDPTAMVLASVDQNGHPDTRVVLLKGIEQGKFIFFTHYNSAKGNQLAINNNVALNFYWPKLARQVRIRGVVEKIPAQKSDMYFASRPKESQVAASIATQSQVIKNRAWLEMAFNNFIAHNHQDKLTRPKTWGGYAVTPNDFEFWQGRDNRLHDRLSYHKIDSLWKILRLAP
jgi:pyridoxamine 5'-phosphate oxidase